MKQKKIHLVVFSFALAALLALAALAAKTGHGQSAASQKVSTAVAPESGLQPTAAVRERRTEPAEATTAADAAAFVAAASRNSLLRLDLNWAFGGKQQRGWYIYEPLISRLIGSEKDSATGDFASALARWQKSSALQPN